jgi:hypothetical protein
MVVIASAMLATQGLKMMVPIALNAWQAHTLWQELVSALIALQTHTLRQKVRHVTLYVHHVREVKSHLPEVLRVRSAPAVLAQNGTPIKVHALRQNV